MMEKDLYFITGTCGVGKSTTSCQLGKKFDLSVHIDVDDIYNWFVGGYVKPWEDDGSRLNLLKSNLICLINNYIQKGYVPIIDYVLFPEDVEYILNNVLNVKVKYVVLMSDEHTIINRDLSRDSKQHMGDRALQLLEEFQSKNINEKHILYTTNMNVDDVVNVILNEDRFYYT